MASFFSPCSFPLLVTLLARHAGIDGVVSKSPSITRNTFSFAIALSLGTALFLLAYAIATAQNYIVGVVRARIVDVKRWGGWILIVVGAWLLILAVFAEFFTGIFPV